MFTGIVTDIGRVRDVRETERDRRYEIETTWDVASIDLGASISHAGCCLTVTEKGEGWFAVEVSGETLSKTKLGDWTENTRVNLERAAKLGDELAGHIVSGHVDGLGEVISITPEGGSDLTANIREKQRARMEYEAAKKEGRTAALLDQHRPNVLQMSVAHILPGDEVQGELRYTELLLPTDGRYRFVYPTVVGPRYHRAASAGGTICAPSPPTPPSRAPK